MYKQISSMATITEPQKVLSQSEILPTASSIIRVYTFFTSAYLFGSYAKGTARPDSDIDIAVFLPELKLTDIGGAHMDLEEAFGKKVDLSLSPSGDFLERIKKYWLPINIGPRSETVGFSLYVFLKLRWSLTGNRLHHVRSSFPFESPPFPFGRFDFIKGLILSHRRAFYRLREN
jgi:predicted nucleotidyltransferase